MIPVRRLNHAVLYVSDLDRAVMFYQRHFGFRLLSRQGPMAFLRAADSTNHHDLGLMGLGAQAPRPAPGSVGLYHLAWEVGSMEDLAQARAELLASEAYVGESDHGATKSVYGADPDGNEFEIMYLLPRDQWGPYEDRAVTQRLQWPAKR
jgi:catechol-2,3-dioxygenase